MIARNPLKLCLTGLAFSVSAPLLAQPMLTAQPLNAAKDLDQTIAADEAQVRKLEYEVISSEQALDEAKSAKPADRESIDCAKEANAIAKTNLAAARKKLAVNRAELAKADKMKNRGQTRLADGAR